LTKRKTRKVKNDLHAHLAEYFIQLKPGEQICSVREFASHFDSSLGAISKAIQELEAAGAVEIERRGHVGSFLLKRSLGYLWDMIEAGPLVIAITIPSNLRFEGLATALKSLLEKNDIEAYFIFIRGSTTRLKALRNDRCHSVVLSQLTAEGECSPHEEVALSLPPSTWLLENQVYQSSESIDIPVLRVGVDPDSFDHYKLTKLEFKNKKIEEVRTNFTQLPRLLIDGVIDATIWNTEEIRFLPRQGLLKKPLSDEVKDFVRGKDTTATLIVKAGDVTVHTILEESISIPDLVKIQGDVLNGSLVPEY
jgi:hypothetical protein